MMGNFLSVTLGTEYINKVLLGDSLIWVRDQGLAKDYPGTGWYKATDTGIVYNKDVPEGETYTFEGDPIEYISVWRNEGIDLTTFTGSEEDGLKLLDWHRNLHRYATSNVTDMSYWMYIYGNDVMYRIMGISPDLVITDPVDISHYDTSNVTNMEYMFTSATSFNQSLDNFDTSNVTNMERMFYEATTFNQPLDSFDTSNVTNMSNMFYGAEAFNQALDNFITSNVTNMKYMFSSASSFNQDISSWDTSKVEDMEYMFRSATTFNQDLSQWCVPLLSTVPTRFDYNATNWSLPRPVWGTCPRGEDSI